MSDLISRADAIRAVAEHFSFDDGCSKIYKDIDYYKGIAEHILKNVPSALPSAEAEEAVLNKMLKEEMIILPQDYVKVVRCKDCKWSVKAILDEYCVECTMYHTSCMNHGYCHHGERKNDSE